MFAVRMPPPATGRDVSFVCPPSEGGGRKLRLESEVGDWGSISESLWAAVSSLVAVVPDWPPRKWLRAAHTGAESTG